MQSLSYVKMTLTHKGEGQNKERENFVRFAFFVRFYGVKTYAIMLMIYITEKVFKTDENERF